MSMESEACQYCGMSGAHSPECPTQFKADERESKEPENELENKKINVDSDQLDKLNELASRLKDLVGKSAPDPTGSFAKMDKMDLIKDRMFSIFRKIALDNPKKNYQTADQVAQGLGFDGEVVDQFKDYHIDSVKKIKKVELETEALPAVGIKGTWRTKHGYVTGKVIAARIGGPYEIKTNEGIIQVDKIF